MSHGHNNPFKSIRLTTNFLEQGSHILPVDGDEYYKNLVQEYEKLSGEKIGIGQDEGGDVFVGDIGAEARFAETLKNFLPAQDLFTNEGEVMKPSMLRLYYRRYLKDGNYPEGSPVHLRFSLFAQYENLVSKLPERTATSEMERGWDEIAEQIGVVDFNLEVIRAITNGLKEKFIDNDELATFEILFKLIDNPEHKSKALKLLNSINHGSSGQLYYLPRFADLVGAAMDLGSFVFKDLLTIWDKASGENLFLEFLYNYHPEVVEKEFSSNMRKEESELFAELISTTALPNLQITNASLNLIRKTLDLLFDHEKYNEAIYSLTLLRLGSMGALNGDGKLAEALNALFAGSKDGNAYDQVFIYKLHQYLSNVDNEQFDSLIRRMTVASAKFSSNIVRHKFEIKVFDVIPTDRTMARKLVEMLEDPQEAEVMSEARDIGQYKIIRKKRNGSEGGQNNSDPSSTPPGSPPPPSVPPSGLASLPHGLGGVVYPPSMGVLLPNTTLPSMTTLNKGINFMFSVRINNSTRPFMRMGAFL